MTMTTTAPMQIKPPRQKKKQQAKKKKGWRTAAESDIHELYELSVQDTEAECDFIDQAWKEKRNRLARSVREDFCGTAATSVEWVGRRRENTAVGVDINPEVLAWGRDRAARKLTGSQMQRLTLIESDVLTVESRPVDTVLAMNFSYFLFRTREELRRYFSRVRSALVEDGLFILDAYGGSEAFSELEEERDLDGFTYVWDQNHYNPITGRAVNHIHFRFPDGSEIRNAFTYDWRLWTLPEIQEVLREAGFSRVTVYWEGTEEETGEGDGVFTATTLGEACEGWIAYIVAER